MAAENIQVGQLSVPVVADLKPLERQAKSELKRAAQTIGRDMVADLDRAFQQAQSRARGKLAERLIPRSEFRRQGKAAAEDFNRGLDERISQINRSGKLTPAKLMQLEKFRKTGADAGFEFGDGLRSQVRRPAEDAGKEAGKRLSGGIMAQVNRLPTLIRAALGVALFAWIARGLRSIAQQIASVATLAGNIQQVRGAFQARAQGAGIDPGELMRELRTATLGTVDSVELMRRANLLLNSELPLTAQNVGELAGLFRRLGQEQGKSATEGFGAVSESIARLSPRQLAAYGITVRLEDATKKWADANGRTVSSLTTAERQLALYTAIVEQARAKVAGLGEEQISTAQRVQQVATWWGELKSAVAEGIMQAPRIASFFDAMGISAGDAADRMDDLADSITAMIEAYGGSITGAGIGGVALGALGTIIGSPALGAVGFGIGALGGSAIGQLFDPSEPFDVIKARAREARLAREAMGRGRTRSGVPGVPNADQITAADDALKRLTASMREFQQAAAMGVQPLRDAPGEVQAAIAELVKASEAVKAAEEQIAAIRAGGGQVPAGADAYLAHLIDVRDELRDLAAEEIALWQRELPLIMRDAEKSISRLPTALLQVQGEYLAMADALDLARKRTDAIGQTEEELRRARIAGDPARIAAAEKRLADQRKALRDYTKALIAALKEAGVPAETLNHLTDNLGGLLETANIKVEEGARGWRDYARTLEGVARGVLSVADAMGILDGNTRQALQGVIDLASGIATGGLGGTVQAIGGAIGLLKGAFGRESQMPIIESQANLIRALDRLRDAVLQDITAAEKERLTTQGGAVLGGFEAMAKHLGDRFSVDKISPEALNVIRDIEQRVPGVEIIKNGKIDMEAFRAAMKALEGMDLAVFGHDLTGKLDGLGWIFRSLGDEAGDAAQRLTRFLSVVSDFAPDFTAQLQEIIDTQGHDAAMAWVQSLAEAFGADGLNSELIRAIFGDNLSARDVQRIIDEALGFVGGGAGLIASGRPETRLAVNLTQTQGDELLRIGSTQLYHLAGIHSLIAQMVSAPPPVYGAIPDISPPSPASLGLGSQTINMGGITIQLALTAAESVTPGNARETGERIGAGVDAGVRAAYRGAGTNGPTRFKVEVQ